MVIQGDDYAIGVSVAGPDGFSEYYPLRHMTGNGPPDIIGYLKDFLAKPDNLAVFAHAKFDIEMLHSLGIAVKCECYDILAIDALIDENQSSYSLDAISKRYGMEGKDKKELEAWMVEQGLTMPHNKKKPNYGRMREVPPEVIAPYAIRDAELTLACFYHQMGLIGQDGLGRVTELENDLIPVTWAMRLEGIPVDVDRAEQVNIEMLADGEAYLANVRQTHSDFNPQAARSLEKYVNSFGVYPPRTYTDEPSITNEWLELQTDIPEFKDLAHYRRSEKLRRDFVEGVVLEMSHKGKVHPSWFSTRGSGFMSGDDPNGTRTGRLACEHPNIAQTPRRHPVLGPLMRSLFRARKGEKWHKADYNSQEPRITLHYAVKYDMEGAAEIAKLYYADKATDYHKVITGLVNKVSQSIQIERDQGKTINLGLVYGLGKGSLANKLRMTGDQTEMLLDSYHRAVPYVKPLQRKTKDYADKFGYINTELGRRRRFSLWEPAAFGQRKPALPKAEALAAYKYIKRAYTYRALNAAVQGTAAEQIKSAMIALHREGLTPLVTLYDELGHSIPDDPMISKRICEAMENAIPLRIPHFAEAKMGKDWSVRS